MAHCRPRFRPVTSACPCPSPRALHPPTFRSSGRFRYPIRRGPSRGTARRQLCCSRDIRTFAPRQSDPSQRYAIPSTTPGSGSTPKLRLPIGLYQPPRQFLQPLRDIGMAALGAVLSAQNHELPGIAASAIPIATPTPATHSPPPQPRNCAPSTMLFSRYSNICSLPFGPLAKMRRIPSPLRSGSAPKLRLPIRNCRPPSPVPSAAPCHRHGCARYHTERSESRTAQHPEPPPLPTADSPHRVATDRNAVRRLSRPRAWLDRVDRLRRHDGTRGNVQLHGSSQQWPFVRQSRSSPRRIS